MTKIRVCAHRISPRRGPYSVYLFKYNIYLSISISLWLKVAGGAQKSGEPNKLMSINFKNWFLHLSPFNPFKNKLKQVNRVWSPAGDYSMGTYSYFGHFETFRNFSKSFPVNQMVVIFCYVKFIFTTFI